MRKCICNIRVSKYTQLIKKNTIPLVNKRKILQTNIRATHQTNRKYMTENVKNNYWKKYIS